jgi:hypothetical protein
MMFPLLLVQSPSREANNVPGNFYACSAGGRAHGEFLFCALKAMQLEAQQFQSSLMRP